MHNYINIFPINASKFRFNTPNQLFPTCLTNSPLCHFTKRARLVSKKLDENTDGVRIPGKILCILVSEINGR